MYKVTLKILGKEYTQKGDTIEEALNKFNLGFADIKAKGVVSIKHGKKSLDYKMFSTMLLRRIFVNPITRAYWARNLELLLR